MAMNTPLHAAHIAAGARMVDFAGWEMPLLYDSIIDGVPAWNSAHPDRATGPIILLHDIHQRTINLTPSILDTLLGQGYHFVTISELLELRGQ